MTIKSELKAYYSDLLILQYRNKPKFRAFLQSCVEQLVPINSKTGNILLKDMENSFDIDNAEGEQLDLIGKYVGLSRFFVEVDTTPGNYFGFIEYLQSEIPSSIRGFSDYSDFETKEGETLNYVKVTSGSAELTDFDYRSLLKLKIVKNNNDATVKTIDDALDMFFDGSVFFEEVGIMSLIYWYTVELTEIVKFAFERDVLPRPAAVNLTGAIIVASGGYFGMPNYETTIFEPFTGFSTYAEFDSKNGEWLNYEKLTV